MSMCLWCENEYTKTINNQRYCSKSCYFEKVRTSAHVGSRKVHVRKHEKVAPDYEDYIEPDLSKYLMPAVVHKESTFTVEPIAVPDIAFKRYRETKHVIVFMSNQELKRLKEGKS